MHTFSSPSTSKDRKDHHLHLNNPSMLWNHHPPWTSRIWRWPIEPLEVEESLCIDNLVTWKVGSSKVSGSGGSKVTVGNKGGGFQMVFFKFLPRFFQMGWLVGDKGEGKLTTCRFWRGACFWSFFCVSKLQDMKSLKEGPSAYTLNVIGFHPDTREGRKFNLIAPKKK